MFLRGSRLGRSGLKVAVAEASNVEEEGVARGRGGSEGAAVVVGGGFATGGVRGCAVRKGRS